MQQHFAEEGRFDSQNGPSAGEPSVHIARHAESYAIAVDTSGTLLWNSGDLDGEHLICILSKQASTAYLAYLRDREISYIVAGQSAVDLETAMEILSESFSIKTLLLEGGGHINGAFVDRRLVDEVSLLLAPGIDGRHDVPSVFDGLRGSEGYLSIALRLKSVEQLDRGVLWLRYDIAQDDR